MVLTHTHTHTHTHIHTHTYIHTHTHTHILEYKKLFCCCAYYKVSGSLFLPLNKSARVFNSFYIKHPLKAPYSHIKPGSPLSLGYGYSVSGTSSGVTCNATLHSK